MTFLKKIFIFSWFLLFFFLPILLKAQDELSPFVRGDTTTIIANGIKIVLGLVGTLALIFLIYGGVVWMTSGGNVEKVKKGKATFVWAILGLVACFLAYSVVTFIISRII